MYSTRWIDCCLTPGTLDSPVGVNWLSGGVPYLVRDVLREIAVVFALCRSYWFAEASGSSFAFCGFDANMNVVATNSVATVVNGAAFSVIEPGPGTANLSCDHCASSDGTADDFGGTGNLVDQDPDDLFVDPNNGNLMLSISGYSRDLSQNGLSCYFTRAWFTPWGWGTWRNRLERVWASLKYNDLSVTWDVRMGRQNIWPRKAYPIISGAQNIGAHGAQVPSAEWHARHQHTPRWAGHESGEGNWQHLEDDHKQASDVTGTVS